MRAFIAIDLPEDIRKYLVEVQKQISDDLAKINWVKEENIHLTLKFLGEQSEETINKIKESLKDIKFKKNKFTLDGAGVFPNENYIKVIWIDLKPAGPIAELQQKIDSRLAESGFKKDDRFKTHLTIGRVKFVKDKKALVEKLKSIKPEEKEFILDGFVLKKSTLTEKGPVYEDIETRCGSS